MESRLAPATFVVNSRIDPGNGVCDPEECTLREAISAANATPGYDTINFDIAGAPPHEIEILRDALPAVTDSVMIDGTSEPDYRGTPVVIVDAGPAILGGAHGLVIEAGDSTVRGLVIGDFPGTGLVLRTRGNNVVQGNYIGTNVLGTVSKPNLGGGITVTSSNGNVIGGTTIAGTSYLARNLVSGNGVNGINLANSSNNRIQGNYVGTNLSGSGGLGNAQVGIRLGSGCQNNLLGTNGDGEQDAVEGNVISGNGGDGVGISGSNVRNNRVAGNRIGTNAGGTGGVGNGRAGIYVRDGAQSNWIGTDGSNDVYNAAERNVISGNNWDGIFMADAGTSQNVVAGNYLGVNAAGTAALRNGQDGIEVISGPQQTRIGTDGNEQADDVERNVISGNGTRGIALDQNASRTIVAGNYIGTNAAGTATLSNGSQGILMDRRSDFNRVGTDGDGRADEAERNVIAGNNNSGVLLNNVRNTRIAGNYIGTDATGTLDRGNGEGCGFPGCAGVSVYAGSQFNVIGTNGDGQGDVAERNVIAGNASDGVVLADANTSGNTVAGNFIGTDVTGGRALRNGRHGVFILRAGSNRVGTDNNGFSDDLERNVIGANGVYYGEAGVMIFGTGATANTVAGNYIGTDVMGTTSLDEPSHAYGVLLGAGATNNVIGGTVPVTRNVISGNLIGVEIANSTTTGNQVLGNYIGTQADGTSELKNLAHGVLFVQGASNNTIGGTAPGAGNVIAFNGGSGVVVAAGTRNSIRGNSIHSNVGLGIDLAYDSVTPIDYQDADAGPNQLQNYPELLLAWAGAYTIGVGTLHSLPSTTFTFDLYANTTPDPTDYGEGERYLGAVQADTDAEGNAVFVFVLETPTAVGEWIAATATDPAGNTSEFSRVVPAELFSGPGGGAPGRGLPDPGAAGRLEDRNRSSWLLPVKGDEPDTYRVLPNEYNGAMPPSAQVESAGSPAGGVSTSVLSQRKERRLDLHVVDVLFCLLDGDDR